MNALRLGRRLLVIAVLLGAYAASSLAQLEFDAPLHVLIPTDGNSGDRFGAAVAIEDDRMVITSHMAAYNGLIESGRAHLYEARTGRLITELIPDDIHEDQHFGTSVDIEDGLIAIGAMYTDEDADRLGAVYIFDAETGRQIRQIIPDDLHSSKQFGFDVFLDGRLLLVGARTDREAAWRAGAVYLFDVHSGVQLAKYMASDASSQDEFGFACAMDDGYIAVGAPGDNTDRGAVYVFDMQGNELYKIEGSQFGFSRSFGYTLDTEDGILVVGDQNDDTYYQDCGTVYFFQIATGELLGKIYPDDLQSHHNFGNSVYLDRGKLIVGAWDERRDHGSVGGAYVFDVATRARLARLFPANMQSISDYGTAVAIDVENDLAIVGAMKYTGPEFVPLQTGGAIVFDLIGLPEPCLADANYDGAATPADYTAWVAAFNSGSPQCDQNRDGACTPADFTAWIANFNAGC